MICGIDPGLSGALFIIDPEYRFLEAIEILGELQTSVFSDELGVLDNLALIKGEKVRRGPWNYTLCG